MQVTSRAKARPGKLMPSVIKAGGRRVVLISLPSAHFIKWLLPVLLICPIVPEPITPTQAPVCAHCLAEPKARVAQSIITLKFVYPVKKWLTAESYANASNLCFLLSSLAEVTIWLLHHKPEAWCCPWPGRTLAEGLAALGEKAKLDHFPRASPSFMGMSHLTTWLPSKVLAFIWG